MLASIWNGVLNEHVFARSEKKHIFLIESEMAKYNDVTEYQPHSVPNTKKPWQEFVYVI